MAAVTMNMAAVKAPVAFGAKKSAFSGSRVSAVAPKTVAGGRASLQVRNASGKEMRDRIASVNGTKKITEAMKLVAAAKVRRAQDAVINARPFSESLVKVLFAINTRLAGEDVDVPLCNVRPVKTVLLLVCTGDRGLCGGFNNFIIRKTEARVRELEAMGVKCKLVCIGKKGGVYFKRRPQYDIVKRFDMGQSPTTEEAQTIADEVYSEFVGEEVDKVELVYSRFVSLIAADPSIQTLLPMSKEGEICDVNGQCLDAKEDIMFTLTSEDGKFAVKGTPVETEVAGFEGVMQFEQDPNQILDALLPLYMNSQILRALQESLASELAARMNAMSSASDNAKDLSKRLTLEYNRVRQAKVTSEIIELVAGASAAA
jgi:F-type H+-transporting ATPase subunit gamma